MLTDAKCDEIYRQVWAAEPTDPKMSPHVDSYIRAGYAAGHAAAMAERSDRAAFEKWFEDSIGYTDEEYGVAWAAWQAACAAPPASAVEALRELVAMVRGECPSLLDEDSGGNARLSMEIDAILQSLPAGGEG